MSIILTILLILNIIFWLGVTIVYMYIYSRNLKKEQYISSPPPISYSSKNDLREIVYSSPYFKNMNDADLYARKVRTREQYMEYYISSYRQNTTNANDVIHRLEQGVSYANDVIYRFSSLLYNIPWKFVFVNDDIENGYPHTHKDVIVLSYGLVRTSHMETFVKTLIHEKVHVFQRMYPYICASIINQWGFKPINDVLLNDISRYFHGQLRSNPDIDGKIYSFHKKIIAQVYNSNTPSSIADTKAIVVCIETGKTMNPNVLSHHIPSYVQQIEHPYEIMACMIPVLFTGTEPTTILERVLLFHIT